ncbi:divalent-cation tolerance protein CutA [Nocardia jinanensis]|uniref:divalent-cation tolerance protein CutA n=1 Tax=Nocardia jinanensis TaxID=382504 RepID=UPI0007A3BFD8|nr:divalent-cation tolerance protein CutA [Nocardia jinanensis]
MSDNDLVDVTVSGPDEEWLAEFTHRLVTDRLAACGNIFPDVRSIYRWEGAVEDASEAVVVLHTRASLVPAIVERANAEHPDEVPQVVAVPVADVNPAYGQWILDETVG